MKLNLLVKTLVAIVPLSLVFFINSGETHSNAAGAPAARTGSPGDGSNCRACHSGAAPPTANLISSDIPEEGYTPGTTYNISATISSPISNKFGFEISPQNITGQLKGTLIATEPTRTQLLSAGKYITHKAAGNAGTANSNTWTFQWIAPAAGSGELTFYGAFVSANSNNNSLGDAVFLSTLSVVENEGAVSLTEKRTTEGLYMFPIPCSDLLTIKIPSGMDKIESITIISTNGAEKKKLQKLTGQEVLTIDMSDLASGTYTALIKDVQGQISYKRIIKL
ncbi:MAG: hypothetical protein K0S33_3255 [Bacteroidetes bacterium]|jgi:hypothetical protein|nr:hypothetical protein [Bacteroidota bacterium]